MTNKQLFWAKRGLSFALCFLVVGACFHLTRSTGFENELNGAVGGIRGGDVSISLGINAQSVLNFVETNFLMVTKDYPIYNGMMLYRERSAII